MEMPAGNARDTWIVHRDQRPVLWQTLAVSPAAAVRPED